MKKILVREMKGIPKILHRYVSSKKITRKGFGLLGTKPYNRCLEDVDEVFHEYFVAAFKKA